MSGAQLKQLLNDATVVPITVEQYHRMIETGILEEGEPIELLDGMLVRKDRSSTGEDPMTVGKGHMWVVRQLPFVFGDLPSHGCHFQAQLPIAIPPGDVPEPDGAIVRGTASERRDDPGPEDVICVIEVSDSSLNHDRITKQRIYADGGIRQYLIINLVDGLVEEYRDPQQGSGKYRSVKRYSRQEVVTIELPDGSLFNLSVACVLP